MDNTVITRKKKTTERTNNEGKQKAQLKTGKLTNTTILCQTLEEKFTLTAENPTKSLIDGEKINNKY